MSQTDRLKRIESKDYTNQEQRDLAWERFANIPHADLNVGRDEYRAEIERINQMERDQ